VITIPLGFTPTEATDPGASDGGACSRYRYRGREAVKDSDRYHKWVAWSDEDQVCIGKCPDLITGIHGGDPVSLYSELREVIDEVIAHFQAEGRSLPKARVRPMSEVA
jgi:hypothetical protein